MSATASYMLIFRDHTPEAYKNLNREQLEECLQNWNDWLDGIAASGKLLAGNPLGEQGRVVSGTRGERVQDGPFAEAKEFIGGYFLLAVSSWDEATEIAQRCPNLAYGMTVEIRPVATACHLAHALGRDTMKPVTA